MRPFFASIVAAVLVIVAVGLSQGSGAPPAEASFHFMRIYGVMGGSDSDAGSQFVELRQASGGQNLVHNAQLCFFDADGVPWARFVFPDDADSGISQRSILIGSPSMAAEWHVDGGAAPDFIFDGTNTTALDPGADVNAPIPVPNGAIVYEDKTDETCGMVDAIDAIAYGSGYNGGPVFGDVLATDLPANGDGFQLKATPVSFPPTDNSTEYGVATCIVARNNDGAEGPVGGGCEPEGTPTPTPTPSPTASPSPTPTETATQPPTPSPTSAGPIMGDADCDGDVEVDDGLAAVKDAANLGSPTCNARTDVNCDDGHGVDDALEVFRYLAEVGRLIPAPTGCAEIGQPVS